MVMKDCNFYCCDSFKDSPHCFTESDFNNQLKGFRIYGELESEEIFYCPFCGAKLR